MNRLWWVILVLVVAWTSGGSEIKPLTKLNAAEMRARFEGDVQTVQLHRRGLLEVIEYQKAHPELFPGFRAG